MLNRYRTLIVLGVAQCFGQTTGPTMVLLGGLVGAQIAPSLEWATLPLAMMVVGMAATTIPASFLMSRIGRRGGFLIASFYSVVAALLAAFAIFHGMFVLYCVAGFFLGSYGAFMQQFRFAVAESVPMALVPRSLSILMLAGIVAAYMGPEMAKRLSDYDGLPVYVGSYLGLAFLLACSFLIVLLFYREVEVSAVQAREPQRPLGEIVRQHGFLLAVTSGVVGWSIMSLVMTATPVSMHEMEHHSLADTTWVIQSHVLAMYVPSLFSGFLITWFGVKRIIQAGMVLMIGCVFVGYGRPELMHYWGALVLLGVGWNFLFLGGTTLLTQTYRASERFKVQALNDFTVFSLQAFGSLGAGVLLAGFGWNGVMMMSLPWIVVLVPVLILTHRNRASAEQTGP
jgi:MFS family permease